MTFAFLLPLLAQASLAQAAGPAADPNLDALVPRAPDRLQTCLHQAQDDPDAAIKTVKESRRLYPTSGNHLLKAAAAKAKQVMPSCAQPVSLRSA